MRRELYRRTGGPNGGYICGERSIGRVIKRAVRAGEIGKKRVKPNRKMVNGQRTVSGTTHTWIVTRWEQRKARKRLAEEKRQAQHARARQERERLDEEERARVRELARHVSARTPSAALVPAPFKLADLLTPARDDSDRSDRSEKTRAEVARQLAALAAAKLDPPGDDPPDK